MGVTPGPWRLPDPYDAEYDADCPRVLGRDDQLVTEIPTNGFDLGAVVWADAQFIATACNAFHNAAQSLGVDPLELARKVEGGFDSWRGEVERITKERNAALDEVEMLKADIRIRSNIQQKTDAEVEDLKDAIKGIAGDCTDADFGRVAYERAFNLAGVNYE